MEIPYSEGLHVEVRWRRIDRSAKSGSGLEAWASGLQYDRMASHPLGLHNAKTPIQSKTTIDKSLGFNTKEEGQGLGVAS